MVDIIIFGLLFLFFFVCLMSGYYLIGNYGIGVGVFVYGLMKL